MRALDRLASRLAHNARGAQPSQPLSPARAATLLRRLEHVPFFAHSYSFILNMDHGAFLPADLVEFAYRNGLDGLCLHINDGDAASVAMMTPAERADFRQLLADLNLRLHLEISSTERHEVDLVARIAGQLGVTNIRFYARHEGRLSEVLEMVYRDLSYATELANARNLCFDYEQHEDLRAAEIADVMQRIGDPRLNVLFDYTNSWNAYEEPLDALRILSPWIRQAHLKGGRRTVSAAGWGQVGVPQGAPEDELPSALLLHELLMLGEDRLQVIAFALEQEAGYVAPPFRGPSDEADPIIAAREPSQTLIAADASLDDRLADEMRWAEEQVSVNRRIVSELKHLAEDVISESQQLGRAAPGV